MATKQEPVTINKPSALDHFKLSFEYDKTVREVKRDVKARTYHN